MQIVPFYTEEESQVLVGLFRLFQSIMGTCSVIVLESIKMILHIDLWSSNFELMELQKLRFGDSVLLL